MYKVKAVALNLNSIICALIDEGVKSVSISTISQNIIWECFDYCCVEILQEWLAR